MQVILWDIDGTLLNFEEAEKCAIRKCFEIHGMGECTDEMLSRYSQINKKYWERLERGELTKPEVLIGRFEEFFRTEGLDVSKAVPFNEDYQVRLGDTICFCDDGYELVKKLKGQVRQYAVTNGTYIAQSRKLERSGLGGLFDDVFISDQIGHEKPNREFFDVVWAGIGEVDKSEVMIVGDSLTSDMRGGNVAGIFCCWYNPKGVKNDKGVRVDKEIRNLWEIEKLL